MEKLKFRVKKAFLLPDGKKAVLGEQLELSVDAAKYLLTAGKVERVKQATPVAQEAAAKPEQAVAGIEAKAEPKADNAKGAKK
jgi:hypothetical protein